MNNKNNYITGFVIGLTSAMLGSFLFFCIAWTYTYDTATPAGTDAPSVIDDRIREVKAAIQERMNVDHVFPLTGTQVSDSAVGQHRQVEFYEPISTPTNASNKGFLYTKDVSDKAELHFEDEDGDEIQLTDGGSFNISLLTSKTITTPTLTTPTLTSPVFNTGVSGTAVLDEDDMASDSATQLATQQSIKAYVDTSKTSAFTPTSYSGGESVTLPNGLILKFGIKAVSASSTATVTFGTAFPTDCIMGVASPSKSSGDCYGVGVHTETAASMKLYNYDNEGISARWIAIGY